MEDKIKIIALFGMSCSGKDFLKREILKKDPSLFNAIIHSTTRPKRDYEKNCVDYYFLSVETFAEAVYEGHIVEAQNFNNWYYGTDIRNLKKDKINIGIFSPESIRQMKSDSRFEIQPVWVLTPDKERLTRALNREQSPDCYEICRRFIADAKDFDDIDFDFKVMSGNLSDVRDFEFEFNNVILKLFGQNDLKV